MAPTKKGSFWALLSGAGLLFIYAAVQAASLPESLRAPAEAVSKKDFKTAAQMLQSAAPAEGYDKDRAELILGYSLFHLGEFAKARSVLLGDSLPRSIIKPYRIYYAAHSCLGQKEYDAGAGLFRSIIRDKPSESLNARSLYYLGRTEVEMRDYISAKSTLDKLEKATASKASWKPEILYMRAGVEKGLENPLSAEQLLRRVWTDYPYSKYSSYGEVYQYDLDDKLKRVKNLEKSGEKSRALSELESIIESVEDREGESDKLCELYRMRASIYIMLRRYGQAADEIEKIEGLMKDKDASLLYDKAKALSRLDRDSEAIEVYREIWKKHPKSSYAPRALYRAGRLRQLDLEHDKAMNIFGTLIKKYPNHELSRDALFQAGWMYYLDKKYKKAVERFDLVPEIDAEPVFNARTLYWKARALEKSGNPESSRKLQKLILEKYPYTAYACFIKKTLQAKPAAASPSAIEDMPVNAKQPGRLELAGELVSLGLWDDAREELESLGRKSNLSDAEILAMARLYERTGDYFHSHRLVHDRFANRLERDMSSYPEYARLAYPLAFPDMVEKHAEDNGLDPLLVMAVIYAESRYSPDARSSAGAVGLMQLMPATAKRTAAEMGDNKFGKTLLTDPDANLKYGCYHLAKLIEGNSDKDQSKKLDATMKALASYNAGQNQVDQWNKTYEKYRLEPEEFLEIIPYTETRIYVRKVLGQYARYQAIYPEGLQQSKTN